ncbi:Putative 3-hydroxyacyl-CoA dehydratase [Verticillium dahliae VDG2]|nr:Putative 3-hydroxyacyl-CoA dehydratase [Verticillium dahliae VDG2]
MATKTKGDTEGDAPDITVASRDAFESDQSNSGDKQNSSISGDGVQQPTKDKNEEEDFAKGKSWRFWAIFPAIMFTTLLSAIEVTVLSTAMPTIVHELDVGNSYAWIINSFLLTSTAFLPVIGQLADAWGRRWPTIISVAIFTVGSGICGGANNAETLIVGRAIQGLGSGGLNMLIDLIICDLIPLRERGKFIGLVNLVFAVGLFTGPFIGGSIVQHTSWRWVFWISVPIGGVSLLMLYAFLRVNYVHAPFKERVKTIDYIGNIMVLGSTTAILHPTIPPHLFGNRTSSIAFLITFLHALMTLWTLYFLPVYFQAVQLVSPSRSGVQILPTVCAMIPPALIAGQYLSRTGRYKLLHVVGSIFMAAGLGSFAALNRDSSTAAWVCLQMIPSFGNGLLTTSLLPAVQACLTDEDNASSTSTWAYVRSYGAIWGVTIPATTFNNIFSRNLWKISDPAVRAALGGGNAYSYAARDFIKSFPVEAQNEIREVYTDALRISWAVAAGIMGLAVVFSFFEKDVALRASLQTQFGIKEEQKEKDEEASKPGEK